MQKITSSAGSKTIAIALLCLVLWIPSLLIQSLIHEREQRKNEAFKEVSDKWGSDQMLGGPVLVIPLRSEQVDDKGNRSVDYRYAHFLPEQISIRGRLRHEIRYRGIYKMILYNSQLRVECLFPKPDLKNLGAETNETVRWNDAFVIAGISDLKGIKNLIELEWNGKKLKVQPGLDASTVFPSGIRALVPLSPQQGGCRCSFTCELNGSNSLSFIPVGESTTVELEGDWPHPSFTGGFLPDAKTLSSDGFSAQWKVLYLNRNFPQQWIDGEHDLQESAFGVKLFLPVNEYQKSMRMVKYALMFILLTFLAYFILEIYLQKPMHPVQYLLIGLGLVLFYSLLLSVSEHTRFPAAYMISSSCMVAIVAAYTRAVLSSAKGTVIIAGTLITLYAYFYILLQIQDYALLVGNIGLVVILATVMYLTRSLNWGTFGKTADSGDRV
jgi:inner membrane protein